MTARLVCRWLTVAIVGTVLALTLMITPMGTSDGWSYASQLRALRSGIPDRHARSPCRTDLQGLHLQHRLVVPVDAGILASIESAGSWDRSQTVATLTVT